MMENNSISANVPQKPEKKAYEKPKLELVELTVEDAIASSNELPLDPIYDEEDE